ncbi:hypothetical protein BV25DRAFT_1890952 [Artomyces pyxidatus]|uniref:Uncharacterized protein n=1 Tax=Artomyces pyxidatus TaxID=48021 RepID=A0ACB8SQU7_9AGAM|nr:hypothetical protein BV25DRAFT_1890952 [Artomyces pyxidatus]
MSFHDATTIVHNGPNGGVVHLPLRKVEVKIKVIDVCAQIVLAHTFANTEENATKEAKFMFPVPASAAVCAFQMETSSGGLVVGVVKERSEAQAAYAAAVDAGSKMAGIVNWAADDIFTMSVGSIPPKTTVRTKLICVMNLMDNATPEEVRLQLPMAVGALRYGTPPPDTLGATSAVQRTRLHISVTIQTGGELLDVSSPSHPTLSSTPYLTHHGTASGRRMTASMKSPTFLESDFVLAIRARGFDAPRAFAEVDDETGTVAIQLSVVPSFNIPRVPIQEYIFLVDRSGSMSGGRIETARVALTALLKALPSEGTMFNIFSFGNECNSMWPISRSYDQRSIQDATNHVGFMEANYGGTEIKSALEQVFRKRNVSIPTAVFVLTDGESHDIADTTAAVRHAVRTSAANAPLRVFTLGIGDTASSAMCHGIAHEGQGVYLFAISKDEIIGKCAALVRAGKRPLIEETTVDWGVGTAQLNTPDEPNTTFVGVELRPPPTIQQAPATIESLYKGRRFVVYAILKTGVVPNSIILRGKVQNGVDVLNLPVPVKGVKSFGEGEGELPIHVLAARNIIYDLQAKKGSRPDAIGVGSEEDIWRAAIVRLGVQYKVVSKHTSFVAVDGGEQVRAARTRMHQARYGRNESRDQRTSRQTYDWNDYLQVAFDRITGAFSAILGYSNPRPNTMPGALPSRGERDSDPDEGSEDEWQSEIWDEDGEIEGVGDEDDDGYSSAMTHSTMSSLESLSDWEEPRSRPRQRQRRERPNPRTERRSPSPQILSQPYQQPHSDDGQLPAPPIEQQVLQLMDLQSFDGSFAPNSTLEGILGENAMAENTRLGVDEKVWASVLAMIYLEKRLIGQRELLDSLVEKIMEYLEKTTRKDKLASLVSRAKQLVV